MPAGGGCAGADGQAGGTWVGKLSTLLPLLFLPTTVLSFQGKTFYSKVSLASRPKLSLGQKQPRPPPRGEGQCRGGAGLPVPRPSRSARLLLPLPTLLSLRGEEEERAHRHCHPFLIIQSDSCCSHGTAGVGSQAQDTERLGKVRLTWDAPLAGTWAR